MPQRNHIYLSRGVPRMVLVPEVHEKGLILWDVDGWKVWLGHVY